MCRGAGFTCRPQFETLERQRLLVLDVAELDVVFEVVLEGPLPRARVGLPPARERRAAPSASCSRATPGTGTSAPACSPTHGTAEGACASARRRRVDRRRRRSDWPGRTAPARAHRSAAR